MKIRHDKTLQTHVKC